jgi:serine/threonine protein phosphatase PrpC
MMQVSTRQKIKGFFDTRQGGRPENQDSCASIDTKYGLLVIICDGMGGGPAGKLASTTAIKSIEKFLNDYTPAPQEHSSSILIKAIEYAHKNIKTLAEQDESRKGMGTTVATVLFTKGCAILAHVGDTRIYQYRHKKSIFRTKDHSLVGELVRNGTLTEEQARLSSQANIITRALGTRDYRSEIDIRPYKKGDRFMICTDGIWGMYPEKELIKLTACPDALENIVHEMVENTDAKGFSTGGRHDNLSIALIETEEGSIMKDKNPKKWKYLLTSFVVLLLAAAIIFWHFFFN